MYKSKPNIVGIGNSQVPTNAMLGGLAYQDSVGEIVIDKIKARVSDDATDIFVYDTRKDSDGGAWRKRTQHTSWYNEPSAGISSFRGSRKEFPAVAVIVAEQSPAYKLTIYDGDDPNLSLWMQWIYKTNDPFLDYSSPGSHHLGNYAPVALSAMNGIVCVGTFRSAGHINNLNAGLREFHFIKDTCFATNNDKRVRFPTSIADRNVVTVDYKQVSPNTPIVNSNVNDVAMTVLPNAPIDASTGLPVPTIAVATDGGTNVINDNGTVTQGYQTIDTEHVDLHPDGFMTDGISGATNDSFSLYKIGTIARLVSYGHRVDAQDINTFLNEGTGECLFEGSSNKIAIAQSQGLLRISEEIDIERASDADSIGLHNRTTSSYNTGWMVGDIKGAFLSSTNTTNLTDTQAVTNPGPYSNTTGWAAANAGWSVSNSNNRLVIDSGSQTGSYFGAAQTLTLVDGTKYVLVVNIHSQTKTAVIRLTADGNYFTTTGLGTGEHAFYFTANQASHSIFIGSDTGGTNRTQEVSSVTIREVEEDRSVNDKGLQVYGTVTKSTVATGAELVAYSGFSGSNYLQQAVNSDLQFGTGDWVFYGWYNDTGGSGARTIFEIGRDSSAGDHIGVRHDSSNLELFISDDSFSSQDVAEFSASAAAGWQFSCAIRRGNKIELWNNGVLKASTTITNATGDLGDSETYLRFGNRTYTSQPWDGSLALWRVSKTAPTGEQIKKMYNDEKCLFHENAKCTLHGTSDDVKALAFDDTTNVLHVGTSSGRSQFQGLNRINNTTTAVTTAISASNELVAEQ